MFGFSHLLFFLSCTKGKNRSCEGAPVGVGVGMFTLRGAGVEGIGVFIFIVILAAEALLRVILKPALRGEEKRLWEQQEIEIHISITTGQVMNIHDQPFTSNK